MTEVIPGGAYQLQDKKTRKDESNLWNADDMGWPDLLVSDVMVMMAADDCRG
jgi:hypothetical protein